MKDETDAARQSIISAKWELNQGSIQIKTILSQNLILKIVNKMLIYTIFSYGYIKFTAKNCLMI